MTLAPTRQPERPVADLAREAQRAFWQRAGAVLIDLIVLALVTVLVDLAFGVRRATPVPPVPVPVASVTVYLASGTVDGIWLVPIWLAYYIALEALFGATVGKWASGLRVVDRSGRQRPSLWQAVVRNLLRVVDGLPSAYLLGAGIALGSSMRQRLGDHLAGTLVLEREAAIGARLSPPQMRRRLALVATCCAAFLVFCGVFFYVGRPPIIIQGMFNTREMIFDGGATSYSLGAPTWGNGTVTYPITFRKEHPADTCQARLTLAWEFPAGWVPRYAETTCATDRH